MVLCEQKLLAFPFDPDRFIKYRLTTLEADLKPKIMSTLDLGVHVDLLTPGLYQPNPELVLDPADEELCEEPVTVKPTAKPNKYDMCHSSYLRKSSLFTQALVQRTPSYAEALTNEDDLYLEPEVLIPKIVAAFEKQEFVHPTKPHLKVAKVYEVVPEMQELHHEFTLMAYNETPFFSDAKVLLKECEDEEGDTVLGLYQDRRKRTAEETEVRPSQTEFDYMRNYKFTINTELGQNDVVMWLDEEAGTLSYGLIECKMQLKKKKVPKAITNINHSNLAEKLINVRFRPEKKPELLKKRAKLEEFEVRARQCAIGQELSDAVLDELVEGEDVEEKERTHLMNRLFGDTFSEDSSDLSD
jgi:hypothetical protein